MMKKILVTGATGFLGNQLITTLLNYPVKIIATSRTQTNAKNKSWFPNVTYVPFDLNDSREYNNHYFYDPDIVIHLAWQDLPHYQRSSHIEKQLLQHCRFLKSLIHSGVGKIVVAGTCFEYGLQEGCLNETGPTYPQTAYAQAKEALRLFLQELQSSFSFNLVWLRLFYLYGTGQPAHTLFGQLDRAIEKHQTSFDMSPGDQQRDYLTSSEAVDTIAKITLQESITGIINCCSGQPIALKCLVEEYLAKQQVKMSLNLGIYPYPSYEPMAFWGDTHRLKAALQACQRQEHTYDCNS